MNRNFGFPGVLLSNSTAVRFSSILLCAVGVATLAACDSDRPSVNSSTTATTATTEESIWEGEQPPVRAKVVRTAPTYPTDLTDLRKLAGYADAIFVGTVKSTNPADEAHGTPWTVADVETVLNLKGDNAGTVRIWQQGGIREPSGTVVLVGDDELLLKDISYVFATVRGAEKQTLIAVYGDVPISADDLARLRATGDMSSGMIGRLRAAVSNPVEFRR
ncbi:hypothetical protein [Mycobacteroides sp. CBMA 271]|uniref:hypothetical protein n=2 Tax=unclassified Mycobacteroides TaxID=2618759 RepID=UPI0014135C94|nr:hypothetical protein [Mycobacteroides sp. CBMA 271]